jgi:hypothetical protein
MNSRALSLSAVDAAPASAHVNQLLNDAAAQSVLVVTAHPEAWQKPLRAALQQSRRRFEFCVWDHEHPLPLKAPTHHFDAVVALDVAALLPKNLRRDFHQELTRVAKIAVVNCGPLGTELQHAFFKNLSTQYRERFRHELVALALPLREGLPVPDEVFTWVGIDEVIEIFYSGDLAAFQQQAERLIHTAGWLQPLHSFIRRAQTLSRETPRELNELETVPMRRHRRFYLYSKRK